MLTLIALLAGSTPLDAQPPAPGAQAADSGASPTLPGRVAGQVLRVTTSGERPVPRQWVVLHGIGLAGGAAIDSTQTSASGEFRMRYTRGADSTMQYFVSTVHHGIAYVSGILPPDADTDAATLVVYDTTS